VLKRALTHHSICKPWSARGLPFGALDAVIQTLGIQVAEVTKVLGLARGRWPVAEDRQVSLRWNQIDCIDSHGLPCLAIEVLGRQRKARQWLETPQPCAQR